jgi:hypothetical protein
MNVFIHKKIKLILANNLMLNIPTVFNCPNFYEKGPFLNYVSILGYLVGQQNAYFSNYRPALLSKNAFLGY